MAALTEEDRARLTGDEVLKAKTIGGISVDAVDEKMNFLNILVYGDPGVGKTVLAGSASEIEEMSPVLIIDIEGGTFSLRNTYPDVDVVRVQNWNQMQAVYDELRRGNTGYKTIVLDSLTEIQKFSMYNIMKDVVNKDSERDPDIPSVREWGKSIEQIRLLVRAYRDLNIHVIFTALCNHDKDQLSGTFLDRPSLPGKLAAEVAAFVDIVGYYYMKMQSGEMKRFLLCQKTERQIAKDRSGRLPQVLEAPTMAEIHSIIYNPA